MIFVVGTKRSGTSLWMQALVSAGLPAIGSAFPSTWGERLAQHNPRGFYESEFRRGVNFETNPHPRSGAFLAPKNVRRHVVKVFPGGLVRSDFGYIDRVVATMRDWRSYDGSVRALTADDRGADATRSLPPWLEWWLENFALVRDLSIRRYPVVMHSYDAVLRDPEGTLGEVARWLGAADPAAAARAVDPGLRHDSAEPLESPPDAIAAVLDALFEAVDRDRSIPAPLLERMNECQRTVAGEYGPILEAAAARDRTAP